MPTSEQLLMRAIRMLSDGYMHSRQARAWAESTIAAHRATTTILLRIGFSEREVSLGTMEW